MDNDDVLRVVVNHVNQRGLEGFSSQNVANSVRAVAKLDYRNDAFMQLVALHLVEHQLVEFNAPGGRCVVKSFKKEFKSSLHERPPGD